MTAADVAITNLCAWGAMTFLFTMTFSLAKHPRTLQWFGAIAFTLSVGMLCLTAVAALLARMHE